MNHAARLTQQLAESKKFQLGTWRSKTAKSLQKAIRAEAGAFVGNVKCVIDGEIVIAPSPNGKVVCVTCGRELPWSSKGTHAGHFLGSRNAYIVLEEAGIHPQCARCNQHMNGNPEAYQIYMRAVYGQEIIDALERRKRGWYLNDDGNEVRLDPFTKVQLCEKRVEYMVRVTEAKKRMKR